jgi:hypothetical protein
MPIAEGPVLDERGREMFHCPSCAAPITHDDLFTLGMRPPHPGESAEEYLDGELLDAIEHPACARRLAG